LKSLQLMIPDKSRYSILISLQLKGVTTTSILLSMKHLPCLPAYNKNIMLPYRSAEELSWSLK